MTISQPPSRRRLPKFPLEAWLHLQICDTIPNSDLGTRATRHPDHHIYFWNSVAARPEAFLHTAPREIPLQKWLFRVFIGAFAFHYFLENLLKNKGQSVVLRALPHFPFQTNCGVKISNLGVGYAAQIRTLQRRQFINTFVMTKQLIYNCTSDLPW